MAINTERTRTSAFVILGRETRGLGRFPEALGCSPRFSHSRLECSCPRACSRGIHFLSLVERSETILNILMRSSTVCHPGAPAGPRAVPRGPCPRACPRGIQSRFGAITTPNRHTAPRVIPGRDPGSRVNPPRGRWPVDR